MNKTLQARLKSRERQVEANGHTFTIIRPKMADMSRDWPRIEMVKRFTVGWDIRNIDLVPGGTPDPEPFDAELFADYIEDEDALWMPLSQAIIDLWKEHVAAKDEAVKN